jgi:acetyl esterase/lipase
LLFSTKLQEYFCLSTIFIYICVVQKISYKFAENVFKILTIMRKTGILFLSLIYMNIVSAQEPAQVLIWPDGAMESNGISATETVNERGVITNISVASFTVYPADKTKNTGVAVLLCPGGGYSGEAAVHEGSQFAEWFAANGITGIVLKYRLPNGHSDIPLKDAQEAMRIIRKRASEWGINPQKVGVAGFSAGGHLASTLLTHFDEQSRPDFGILFYPVITLENDSITHRGTRDNLLGKNPSRELTDYYSNEKQIRKNTPPVLLLLSDDDKAVVPENSILFYQGLKKQNVRSSMHIFPEGGHGWGFNSGFRYHEIMKTIVLDWLSTWTK